MENGSDDEDGADLALEALYDWKPSLVALAHSRERKGVAKKLFEIISVNDSLLTDIISEIVRNKQSSPIFNQAASNFIISNINANSNDSDEKEISSKKGEFIKIKIGDNNEEIKTSTKELSGNFGGVQVRWARNFVALNRANDKNKSVSLGDVFESLVDAGLFWRTERQLAITFLNSMKKGKLLNWPKENKGSIITITESGANFITELREWRLGTSIMDFITKNASHASSL